MQNTQLVAGANHGAWGGWPQKVSTWHAGLFLPPEEGKWLTQSEEQPSGSTCTTVPLLENFLPPPDSIFACQDIWEIQCEKMVAYAHALQFWVEKFNPPTKGKPCLLVESMIKLQKEMECYLSFSDEDVLKGIAPPEETSIIPPEEVTPQSTQPTPAGNPTKEAAVDMTVQSTAEKRPPNKFPGWEKVLHPSRPVVAAGEILPLSRGPRQRPCSQSMGEGLVHIPQTEELSVLTTQLEPPCLPKSCRLPHEQHCHLVLPGWQLVFEQISCQKGFPTQTPWVWHYLWGLL